MVHDHIFPGGRVIILSVHRIMKSFLRHVLRCPGCDNGPKPWPPQKHPNNEQNGFSGPSAMAKIMFTSTTAQNRGGSYETYRRGRLAAIRRLVCVFLCLGIWTSIGLLPCPPAYQSTCLPIYLFIYLSVDPFTCLPICLSTLCCAPIYLPMYLSGCACVFFSTYLSV